MGLLDQLIMNNQERNDDDDVVMLFHDEQKSHHEPTERTISCSSSYSSTTTAANSNNRRNRSLLPNKQVSFCSSDSIASYHDNPYSFEELRKDVWYTPRHYKTWKNRAKKQASQEAHSIVDYENCLKQTYAACRNAVLLAQQDIDDESQPLTLPLTPEEQDYLLQHLHRMTPTRLGLEKTTVFCYNSSHQLLSGIANLQELKKANCATQIARLSQRTSRPARLFALAMGVALEQALQLEPVSDAEEEEVVDDAGARSSSEDGSIMEELDDTVHAGGACHRRSKPRRFRKKLAKLGAAVTRRRSKSPSRVDASNSSRELLVREEGLGSNLLVEEETTFSPNHRSGRLDDSTTTEQRRPGLDRGSNSSGRGTTSHRMLFGHQDSTRHLLNGGGLDANSTHSHDGERRHTSATRRRAGRFRPKRTSSSDWIDEMDPF